MEKYLTQEEIADIMSCTKRLVYELRKNGSIRGVKIGKRWLYPESEIKNYMEKQFQKCNKK